MTERKAHPEPPGQAPAQNGDRHQPDGTSAADIVEKAGSGEPPTKPTADESEASPAAGPHADPALTNEDAAPGSGALSPPGAKDGTDSTSG
jgi:hypothetical protein